MFILGEAETLTSELVDARCGRPPRRSASVRTNLAVAKVVREDEKDVGLTTSRLCEGCGGSKQRSNQYHGRHQARGKVMAFVLHQRSSVR
jgi:hypothetical protein